MARDNKLPAGSAVARVSGARKVPIVPALVTGHPDDRDAGDQRRQPERVRRDHGDRDHHVLPGLPRRHRCRCCVRRFRGTWPRPDHGPYFSLGPLGTAGQHRGGHLTGRSSRSTSRGRAPRSTTTSASRTLVLQVGRRSCSSARCHHRDDLLLRGAGKKKSETCSRSTGADPRAPLPAPRGRRGPMIDAGEFDYVIAGGGTAGCVVAARLSEDPNVTVCLIEAGPSDVDDPNILRLDKWMYLLDSGYDWDYLIEPQEKGNSFMRHARAKVLGGCSSHNSCIAFWTPKEDLDEWEAMGCTGWGSEHTLAADHAARDQRRAGRPPRPLAARSTSAPFPRTTRAGCRCWRRRRRPGCRRAGSTRARRSATAPAGSRSTRRPTTRGCRPRTRTCTRSSARARTSRSGPAAGSTGSRSRTAKRARSST